MPSPARRLRRRSALVLGATTALLVTSAPAASAQTAPVDLVGGAAGAALTLTLNLPGGEATRVVLTLDPVTGTVSRTTTTTATAAAEVLRGSLGGQDLGSGASSAMLPGPLESSSNPTGALAEGLAGTPWQDLLTVELLPSAAAVSAAPTSASEAAVANLGAGLPDELAGALAPLLDPLAGGVDQLLATLATESGMPVAEICAGTTEAVTALEPVTGPLDEALGALPIPVPVDAVLDETVLGAICGLSTTLDELGIALQDALAALTGDSGLLGTGLVTAEQDVTTAGGAVTAVASASLAGLTLLGQAPFADAEALRTTSTATAAGTPGSAAASVDSTIADLQGGTVDPFSPIRTTIAGIRDRFAGEGVLPAELETVVDGLFSTLDAALAPVGITVFRLDDSATAQAIESCPVDLTGALTGTLAAPDGTCAAAATRGVGLRLDLPAALATPLMIGGPLVELQIVPTAAVARAQQRVVAVATPMQLPRTGVDGAVMNAAGLVLLVGAAVLRRRRTTVV